MYSSLVVSHEDFVLTVEFKNRETRCLQSNIFELQFP
jgi:hypothetical protein